LERFGLISQEVGRKMRQVLCSRRQIVLFAVALLVSGSIVLAQERPVDPGGKCSEAEAERAVERLSCVDSEQFGQIEHFREMLLISKSEPDQRALRDILVVASKIAACVNDFHRFPEPPEERSDFHCLQGRLLDFYKTTRKQISEPDFKFQDRLADASSRVHFCMIDEDLPVLQCISMVEGALADYQLVFEHLANQQSDELGGSQEATAPGLPELEQFIDLSLENAERFPTLFGQQFGSVLGPALCKAYQEFPEERNRLAFLYNVLIRFDFANLASTTKLYDFLVRLEDDFRLKPGAPSYLRLDPPDWSTSEVPCGQEEWKLEFPAFSIAPGFRLPPTSDLRPRLEHLHSLLVELSRASGERTHLWKPFVRYGELLMGLAERMKQSSLRSPAQWDSRHLLMEQARDAFLLRGVESGKYPRELQVLYGPISRQIDSYGTELLNGLYFFELNDFAEKYLEYGGGILNPSQKTKLHELLAVGYRMTGDQLNSLSHLQQCDLKAPQLEKRLAEYRRKGIPVPPVEAAESNAP